MSQQLLGCAILLSLGACASPGTGVLVTVVGGVDSAGTSLGVIDTLVVRSIAPGEILERVIFDGSRVTLPATFVATFDARARQLYFEADAKFQGAPIAFGRSVGCAIRRDEIVEDRIVLTPLDGVVVPPDAVTDGATESDLGSTADMAPDFDAAPDAAQPIVLLPWRAATGSPYAGHTGGVAINGSSSLEGGYGAGGAATMGSSVAGDGQWYAGSTLGYSTRYNHATGYRQGFGHCVFGGTDYASGARLDHVGCSLTNFFGSPSLPSARAGLAAVTDPVSGIVYVLGGSTAAGPTNEALRYDVSAISTMNAGSWLAPAPPMLQSRAYFGAARTSDGKIFVIGGEGQEGLLATGEVFSAGAWTSIPPIPDGPRYQHAVVSAPDDTIWVLGGHDGTQILSSVWLYIPSTQQWIAGPSLPQPRSNLVGFVGGGPGSAKVGVAAGLSNAGHESTAIFNGPTMSHAATSGGNVTITAGTGFAPNARVLAYINSTLIGSGTCNASGNMVGTISGALPSAVGTWSDIKLIDPDNHAATVSRRVLP